MKMRGIQFCEAQIPFHAEKQTSYEDDIVFRDNNIVKITLSIAIDNPRLTNL